MSTGDPFALISPLRDEASTLGSTLASVLAQSRRPARWVLVDDGSTDATREIATRAAERHGFIRVLALPDRGFRQPGPGVVRAFQAGLAAIEELDWRYVGKLDGDVVLPGRYYEMLIEAFEADPRLGIASGVCLAPRGRGYRREPNAPFHTRGPCKVYRRACFEDIGGLEPVLGWDGLDGYRARMRGWRTRSLPGLEVLHLRPTHGRDGWLGGARAGRGAYVLHYRPDYLLARAALACLRPPYLLGGLGMALGYLGCHLRRVPRPADPELAAYVHREQGLRLRGLLRRRP